MEIVKNKVKTNNHYTNLKWLTQSENVKASARIRIIT
jgi:hypothetical protein